MCISSLIQINPFPPLAAGGSAVGGRPGGHTAHSGQHGQETAQRLSVHLQTGRRLQPQPHPGYTLQHPTCYTLDARACHDARLQRGRSFIVLRAARATYVFTVRLKCPRRRPRPKYWDLILNSFVVSVPVCLSVGTSVCLSVCLCIFVCQSVSLCLSVSPCLCLPVCLSLFLSLRLSVCIYLRTSVLSPA